jgi:hypothetical protein
MILIFMRDSSDDINRDLGAPNSTNPRAETNKKTRCHPNGDSGFLFVAVYLLSGSA